MRPFLSALIWAGAAALFGAMVLNVLDVVGTKLIGSSIPGAIDFTEEFMVFLTMLPLAHVALEGRHIRFSLIEERFPLRYRVLLRSFQALLAFFICAFVSWRTYYHLMGVMETMELKRGVDFPVWPAAFVVSFSFALLSVAWVLVFLAVLRGRKDGS